MATNAGSIFVDLEARVGKLKSGLDKAMKNLSDFQKFGNKVGASINKTFSDFGKKLEQSKYIMGGLTAALGGAGVASVVAAGKMEQWRVSFETMLGSAEKAGTMLGRISEFAAKTPFELPEVVTGAKNLLAFGIEAEKIIPNLKSLGDVSAGLGVPMERLILNFGQVKAQAKLTGREVRDFAIAGVPIIAELSKNLGQSEAAIQEMVSAGKIGFADVEKAFETMSGAGGRFNNLMQKQSKTLFGVISNLKDNIIRLSISMGEYLLPITKTIANWLMKVTGFIEGLSPEMKRMILVIGGVAAAISGLLTGIGLFVSFSGPILAFVGAIVSPLGIIIGLIGAISVGIYGFMTNFLGLRDAILNSWNAILPVFDALVKILQSVIPNWIESLWSLVTGFFSNSTGMISSFVNSAWQMFAGLFNKFMDTVREVIAVVGTLIPESWKTAIDNLKTTSSKAFGTIKSEFSDVGNNFKRVIDKSMEAFRGFGSNITAVAQTTAESLMMTVQTYQEFLVEKTDEQMKLWIAAKQMEVEADAKAKEFLGIQQNEWTNLAKNTTQSLFNEFGNGVAEMIMEGKKFSDVMKQLWQNLAKAVIAEITKMIAKWLVFMALRRVGGGFFGGGFQHGGIISEPSVITGLRSGTTHVAGEAGPEVVMPMQSFKGAKRNKAVTTAQLLEGPEAYQEEQVPSMNVTVNIKGEFLEGSQTKWQRMVRDVLVPEIRRRTMADPRGLFNRRRGATT